MDNRVEKPIDIYYNSSIHFSKSYFDRSQEVFVYLINRRYISSVQMLKDFFQENEMYVEVDDITDTEYVIIRSIDKIGMRDLFNKLMLSDILVSLNDFHRIIGKRINGGTYNEIRIY